MANDKKTNVLDIGDAAYIGGLVDGEGTITLSRKHRNDNRQTAGLTLIVLFDYSFE